VLFPRPPEALARAEAAVARLRAEPPSHLAQCAVSSVIDYLRDAARRPWYLAEADLLEFRLEKGARVLVRPSGTEPKLKIYADYCTELRPELPLREQEALARERARGLAWAMADLLR
jgi:phosphomannomutase